MYSLVPQLKASSELQCCERISCSSSLSLYLSLLVTSWLARVCNVGCTVAGAFSSSAENATAPRTLQKRAPPPSATPSLDAEVKTF